MDDNYLSGSLPDEICHGGSLRNISLGSNMLRGPIPRSLKNCSKLHELILWGNQFTGNLLEVL
ncbi:OLC1v1035739C1 [Oldenlandia corymbosa var. corymbosa]|uniref:OLC1v1035739C1 n=1 Tax=Oldenlandia corymbosa var. corymbosa TaxID=529605 RepID=A0AAV1CW76_OLDCO|nr:OLC1v1035739C1 [Oldenlandia corymbosa var. corymbosa]